MIIRRKHTANYTALPNVVLTDDRISIAARWCLSYLLSKPHDWKVQITDIQKVGKVGRDKAYSMVRELIDAGWIRRQSNRTDGGVFESHEYIVTDTLEELPLPLPEKPYPVEPDPVQPHPVNTHLTKNGLVPSTERTKRACVNEDFEVFWKAFPRRDGSNPKAAALKAWRGAVKREDPEIIISAAKAYAKLCEKKTHADMKYIPMASTWLNQERWNDIATGGAHALTSEDRKRALEYLQNG